MWASEQCYLLLVRLWKALWCTYQTSPCGSIQPSQAPWMSMISLPPLIPPLNFWYNLHSNQDKSHLLIQLSNKTSEQSFLKPLVQPLFKQSSGPITPPLTYMKLVDPNQSRPFPHWTITPFFIMYQQGIVISGVLVAMLKHHYFLFSVKVAMIHWVLIPIPTLVMLICSR